MSVLDNPTFSPRHGQGRHSPRARAEVMPWERRVAEVANATRIRWLLTPECRYGEHVHGWLDRPRQFIVCTGPCSIQGAPFLSHEPANAEWLPLLACAHAGHYLLEKDSAYIRPVLVGDLPCTVWLLTKP